MGRGTSMVLIFSSHCNIVTACPFLDEFSYAADISRTSTVKREQL